MSRQDEPSVVALARPHIVDDGEACVAIAWGFSTREHARWSKQQSDFVPRVFRRGTMSKLLVTQILVDRHSAFEHLKIVQPSIRSLQISVD